MKPHEMDMDGRDVDDEEANAIDDATEGFPDEPLPTEGLPELTKLEPESTDDKSEGMDKALELMDEYEALPRKDSEE